MAYRARVLEFLSPSWWEAFASALAETVVDPGAGDGSALLVIDGEPSEARFGVAVRDGALTAINGVEAESVEPAVIVRCDRATALRLASGLESAQAALAEGRMQLAGDVRGLTVVAAAAPAIAGATAALRARTRFPSPGNG